MPLQVAVFDFDLTLSACHLYYSLSGGDGGIQVPPPHAETEKGQLARLLELDASPDFRSQGGFALVAFGGQPRIDQLRGLLDELNAAGVECLVCSKGLVGPIQWCLEQTGLTRHFTRVIANIGGAYGGTAYDKQVHSAAIPVAHLLGGTDADLAKFGSKQKFVAQILRDRRLQPNDVVFVDDTATEITNMQGVCLTVHVTTPRGMGSAECDLLRRMLPVIQKTSTLPAQPVTNLSFQGGPPLKQSKQSHLHTMPLTTSGSNKNELDGSNSGGRNGFPLVQQAQMEHANGFPPVQQAQIEHAGNQNLGQHPKDDHSGVSNGKRIVEVAVAQPLADGRLGLSLNEDLVLAQYNDEKATRFGFLLGDVILKINGTPVVDKSEFASELRRAVGLHNATGRALVFQVLRASDANANKISGTRISSNYETVDRRRADVAPDTRDQRPAGPCREGELVEVVVSRPLNSGSLGIVVQEDLTIPTFHEREAVRFGFAQNDRVLRVNGVAVSTRNAFAAELSRAMELHHATERPIIFQVWRASTGTDFLNPVWSPSHHEVCEDNYPLKDLFPGCCWPGKTSSHSNGTCSIQ